MSSYRVIALFVFVAAAAVPLAAQSDTPEVQLSPVTPQAGLAGRNLSGVLGALRGQVRTVATEGDSGVCFAIRSSQFAAERGDVVTALGHSTCQSSRKAKLKYVEMPAVR